jgi:exonuclease SbcC
MLIRLIEVENFLSHKKEEVALPKEGTFLLSGQSGAGKSSFIVDAVAYALFGSIATRAKKQSELITAGAKEMSVRITFDLPDIRLTIARGIDERGSSWSRIWDTEKDEVLAEGVAPSGKIIRQYLGGITWQQFYAAFVARQSEIALLTSLRGAERKNLVQRMLGMRELEKAGEIIASRLRRVAAERDQLEKTLGGFDLLKEEDLVRENEEEIKREKNNLSSLRKELKKQRKVRAEKEKTLKPLLLKEKTWREGEKERGKQAELKVRLEGLVKDLEDHKKAEEFLEKNHDIDNLLLENERKRDDLRELFRRSKEFVALEKKQEGILLEENILPLIQLREEIASRRKGLENFQDLLKEKSFSLEEIEKTGRCSLCKRDTGHSHEEILSEIRRESEDIEKMQKTEEEELKRLIATLPLAEENEKIALRKKQYLERMKELKAEGIERDLSSLESEGKLLTQDLDRMQKILEEARFHRAKINEDLERQVNKIKAQIKDIPPREETVATDDLREELKEAERKENFLLGEIKGAEALVLEKEATQSKRKNDLDSLHKELQLLQSKRSRVIHLEKMQSYLRAYQKHLAHEIRPALEEVGSEMLQRISGGKHKAMHINDDYEIEVEDSSGNLLRSGMISGGEAIRANICLRLALTRLVSQRTGVPIAFLVFDEPLPAQDAGHIEKILELLQSLRPFYQQQFVISHVGDLQSNDAIDYVLSFEEKEKERVHLLSA